VQDRRVRAGGIELQIREYERAADAAVFLHFGGANLMAWQRIVPFFQDRYRLVLVDLRGHGKSDKPETGYHIDEMARDVVTVMQHLKIERAHIVGSSMGAEVGLSMAANDPDKLISLVCEGALYSEYGPYGIWDGSEAEFKEHVAGRLQKAQDIPLVVYPSVDALVCARRQALEPHGWWNDDVEAMVRYDWCETGEGACVAGWRNPGRHEYLRYYFGYRFEAYYGKVKCPVLMLPGEDDWQDERARAAMSGLCALTRQGRIVAVPGWQHPYGWLLDPEKVCAAVLEFLAEA